MFGFGKKADKKRGLTPDFCRENNHIFLRLAVQITENWQWAEDVVQNTMCKLIAGERDLQEMPEAELKQYVLRAVAKNALTYVERLNARPEVSWEELQERAPEQILLAEARAAGDGVLQELLRAETTEQLRACLAKLPARQRAVLILTYFDDQDTGSIAQALGIKPGTVRSLRMRGLKKLFEIMQQEDFGE